MTKRLHAVVQGGVVVLRTPELADGTSVEVTIETEAKTRKRLVDMVGAAKRTSKGKGSFGSVKEADDYINELRGE